MKRILSLLLTAMMLLAVIPFSAVAAPGGYAAEFGDVQGAYLYFQSIQIQSGNGSVTFDLSMEPENGEQPILEYNSSISFSNTYIKIGSRTTSITWGTAETAHFRKVTIEFAGSTTNVYLDGNLAATGTYTGGGTGFYFLGSRGHLFLDNLSVVSAGSEVLSLDFESASQFNQLKHSDSSVGRTQIPSNWYYDYIEGNVSENVIYMFDSAANAAKLSIQSGVEMDRGDCNGDGDITSRDARVLKQVIAGIDNVDYNETLTDVNADGDITAKDSRALKQIIVGLIAPIKVIVNGGAGAGTVAYSSELDAAVLTATGATAEGIDAVLAMTPIDASEYQYAVITYLTPNKQEDHNTSVAQKSAFGAWGNFEEYNLTNDGRFHAQIVDLSQMSTWNGDAATLRFFTAANIGDRIYIDSIIFCANNSMANAAKSAREAANASLTIIDEQQPNPGGAIGEYDEFGNYQVIFDTSAKLTSKVTAGNNTVVSFSDTAVKARATAGGDPGFYVDLIDEGISASTFKYIVYVYKNPSSNAGSKGANIYYVCNDIDRPTGGYETPIQGGLKGSDYNATVYDLTSKSNWTGAIKGLRIDYFTDCTTNDVSYVDSVIFAKNQADANKAMSARLRARNGFSADDTANVWNFYWQYCKNANNYEFITGDNTDLVMYFKFGSYDKLTARSLGDRMARAITNATGYQVSCYITGLQFAELKERWGNNIPEANIYYCIKYEGVSYVVCLRTCIYKDSSFSDPLDGTPADPVLDYYNFSLYQSTPGYSVSDAHNVGTYSTSLAYHSNHESKMCETPYGAFLVYHTSGGNGNQNYTGAAQTSVFRVFDNGSYKKIYTFDCTSHTTKPYIHYGDDGLVYFVQADDEENMSTCAISIGYFDPSQPKSDGTYNISYSRQTQNYPDGAAWSGYGYSSSVIDPSQGKIYIVYNGGGGGRGYYLCWFVYNYRNHTYETSKRIILTQTHRHCYTYLFPDGNGGMYIVGERDVLVADIGYGGILTGADYAWDEINMIHIPNLNSTNYTFKNVYAADYTQAGRELYPGYMNSYSECYVTQDKKLHVFWTKAMHGRNISDGKSCEAWHAVYNVAGAIEPELIYKEPIYFSHLNNCYSIRFCENTSGSLYILAMPSESPRVEIWKATDANGTQFEFKHYKNIGVGPVTAFVAGTRRTNSVVDNTVSCALPCGDRYYSFVVTLPAD